MITHTTISQIMGSTVVAAQLASCLKEKGAAVTVFSTSFANPAKEMFERLAIDVVFDEDAQFDLYSFDYIWVNSQILPLSIVAALDQFNGATEEQQQILLKEMPCFIFNHMGAMEEVSDEYPYIPLLEESLASLEVFVSSEAREVMEPYYDADRNAAIPQVVFPNPAPQQFAFDRPALAQGAKPGSILFVSSHLPEEAYQAMDMLKSQGCEVLHIGAGANEREVTPEVIAQADVVVTIGKTVQYCLCSATPVFVYDYLGGFGYLNDKNIQAAQYANFSGRGGAKMSADQIVSALLDGYEQASVYLQANLAGLREQFDMGSQVDQIFAQAQPRGDISFPYRGYTKTLMQQERFAQRFWKTWYEYIALFEWTRENRDAIDHLLGTIDDIRGSVSFKAGRALTAPMRSLRNVFTRKGD
ncbi:hypothetical protein [Anaerotardibacter muris]|uniref:hypothetical protein n=1 Tax=Anaerotardibacter muris TaxID=2941505 RepID=UPI00203DFDD5|nr:hypothetical protein [Anaerotardibacter muris]